jgi:hypothetical protein
MNCSVHIGSSPKNLAPGSVGIGIANTIAAHANEGPALNDACHRVSKLM